MSGETKFVCQRREFRLVVPADGSNEIPRRLKSCQLLSLSLSLSFSPSPSLPLSSPSSFCFIFLLLSRRRLLETLLVRISRDTFRKEITPVAGEAKKSPGKLHGLSSSKAAHHEEFSLANSFSLSLSLPLFLPLFLSFYTTSKERGNDAWGITVILEN